GAGLAGRIESPCSEGPARRPTSGRSAGPPTERHQRPRIACYPLGQREGLMNLSIRAARPEDAFRLVPLIHAFASAVSESATTGPGGVARHALGPDRVVTTLLAETDGRVVGFAMFHPSYLSFSGTRGLFLTDLFVEASHRRRGVRPRPDGRGRRAVS